MNTCLHLYHNPGGLRTSMESTGVSKLAHMTSACRLERASVRLSMFLEASVPISCGLI